MKKTTLYMRGAPVKHDVMHSVYARILRGIHYRHEFARRNDEAAAASMRLLDKLGVAPVAARTFFAEDGRDLLSVVAAAYRAGQCRGCGGMLAGALRRFFAEFRILPVAGAGGPFLPEECRQYDPDAPKRAVDERAHAMMRKAWNSLLGFEVFAIAEFGLDRPIMMPVLPLQSVRTRTQTVDMTRIVAVTPWAYPVFVDLRQPADVVSDYVCAVAEQTREGDLLDAGRGRRPVVYSEERLHFDNLDYYLEAFDISRRNGNRVDRAEMKKRLFARTPLGGKATATSWDRKYQAFFRRSLRRAFELVADYRSIL